MDGKGSGRVIRGLIMRPAAKRILSFIIFNAILFIVYYLLNVLTDVITYFLKITDAGAIPDMIISFIVWAGFTALYVFMITDRKAFGVPYLTDPEQSRPTPVDAFNPVKELKHGKIDTVIYAVMTAVPAVWYMFDGVKVGSNDVPAELFLPQTLFMKITSEPIIGFVIGVAVFWVISCFTTMEARKKWLENPLTPDEINPFSVSETDDAQNPEKGNDNQIE